MLPEAEEGPIHSDAYIDALLRGHAREPVPLPAAAELPAPGIRQVIRLLENNLPRFNPSFLFEERLAEQLRTLAAQGEGTDTGGPAIVIDRRILFGGAIASGFSIAGAAMLAWRRRH
jgi:hypothetical protein